MPFFSCHQLQATEWQPLPGGGYPVANACRGHVAKLVSSDAFVVELTVSSTLLFVAFRTID